MNTIKMIYRPGTSAAEGFLSVAESNSAEVPFSIKRVYYSYGVQEGIVRGNHAHKTLKQILICVYGKIEVKLDNGAGEIETVMLDDPSSGLYVGPRTWRTMKWIETNSVLLVLASEHYNKDDYIRDYDEFISWVNRESEI